MKSWSNANSIIDAGQDVIATKGKDWVTDLQAASTAVGAYVDTLKASPNNQAAGAIAGVLSNIRVVADCWVDDLTFLGAWATGNQMLMSTAIDDMNAIPDKWSTIADLTLNLMGQYESLEGTSTVLGFAKTLYDQSHDLDTADAVSVDLANAYPAPEPVDTQGIAYVTGTVNVPTDEGIGAPLSGIQLSSDQSDVFTTIADPGGNYEMFVPLQDANFDYANGTLTIVDPISQTNLGSEVVDLTSLTLTNPLQIPTLDGAGCDGIDFDGDDPDCD
jgi:hypothetical protein